MINTGAEMYGGYTVRAMLKDEVEKYRAMFRD